jgi:hypothetical protein
MNSDGRNGSQTKSQALFQTELGGWFVGREKTHNIRNFDRIRDTSNCGIVRKPYLQRLSGKTRRVSTVNATRVNQTVESMIRGRGVYRELNIHCTIALRRTQ